MLRSEDMSDKPSNEQVKAALEQANKELAGDQPSAEVPAPESKGRMKEFPTRGTA